MDCYDAKWCPDGECDLCDLWIARCVPPRRALWLRFRRVFVRLWRRDLSAGFVDLTPPSAAQALRDVAKHAEFEAGRSRANLSPAALGSYWNGHDEAMNRIAKLCRDRAEALDPSQVPVTGKEPAPARDGKGDDRG